MSTDNRRSTDDTVPVVCDLTDASDTDEERLAEYQQVFTRALVARERTVEGIRFRFRDDDGIEAWVRDLAAREQTCCRFFSFTVTRVGGEVLLDGTVVDDDAARSVLDEFYRLPETLADGEVTSRTLDEHFLRAGLQEIRRPR